MWWSPTFANVTNACRWQDLDAHFHVPARLEGKSTELVETVAHYDHDAQAARRTTDRDPFLCVTGERFPLRNDERLR